MVKMTKVGGCYQDNPADFIHFLGLHSMECYGFAQNFFECNEMCPFHGDHPDAAVYYGKEYTVFSDSKCVYKIKDDSSTGKNYYINKDSEDLIIYHSYENFNKENTYRRSKKFQE